MIKKLIACLAVLLPGFHAVRAQTEGVITYENSVNMHRNLPPDRQEMKNVIPEFRTTKMQLFFNGTESIYKKLPGDEEEPFGGGGNVRMAFRMPVSEIYTDTEASTMVALQELMGKRYLVQDSVKMSPWKFGEETKEILGYTCRMAYFTQTQDAQAMRMPGGGPPQSERRTVTQEITAWYTDQLRPSLGPERFGTLPGTVLAIDINNGERVIVARDIALRSLKKGELKAPSNGKEVSPEEFRKLSEEQMERMRNNARPMMRN